MVVFVVVLSENVVVDVVVVVVVVFAPNKSCFPKSGKVFPAPKIF